MISVTATVIRDGQPQEIAVSQLVPGDVECEWRLKNAAPGFQRHHDCIEGNEFPAFWRRKRSAIEVEAKAEELAVPKLKRELLAGRQEAPFSVGRLGRYALSCNDLVDSVPQFLSGHQATHGCLFSNFPICVVRSTN